MSGETRRRHHIHWKWSYWMLFTLFGCWDLKAGPLLWQKGIHLPSLSKITQGCWDWLGNRTRLQHFEYKYWGRMIPCSACCKWITQKEPQSTDWKINHLFRQSKYYHLWTPAIKLNEKHMGIWAYQNHRKQKNQVPKSVIHTKQMMKHS